MTSGYVVTGTDTNVGKTVVAAGLVSALDANYWKPIQAGAAEGTDGETVAALAGVDRSRIISEAYRLKCPCSPHEAARIDGVSIERSCLSLPPSDRKLIVEGAGGIMVPVNDSELMIDLFASWALPIILVARTSLGTINHSLMSIDVLRRRRLKIAGLIFVGDENEPSESAILSFGKIPRLGRLPWLEPLDARALGAAMREHMRLDLLK